MLDEALSTKLEFSAAYSFKKTYPEEVAPNPVLRLSGLGTIGLPLGIRDAEAIKSQAKQAPFGMGERTVVNTIVRDTWEMDSELVSFDNPKWEDFMDQVVKEVCGTLGVNYAASQPRSELYKLLLYESGSHFLPHVDTEKMDGMFATIIVVLPSKFTGGEAHLSHGSLSVKYNSSATSLINTTVMAWYTDVTHEIKPITSGYRLALSYNLIHTTTSLRPALSTNDSFVEEVGKIFRLWHEQSEAAAPEKILYLLEHPYSQAYLRGSALKGSDAHKVAMLDNTAQQYGFQLGLASVMYHLRGPANDGGPPPRRWGEYYSEESEEDEDNLEFVEISEREMNIEDCVDLEGRRLVGNLHIDRDRETIPAELAEEVESGPYDDQEYEGYMGNGAGSLDRWYHRTVLVIWPIRNTLSVLYSGEENFLSACKRIASVTSEEPATEDLQIIDFILSKKSRKQIKVVTQAVCYAACMWKDIFLWNRAIRTCSSQGGLGILKEVDIFKAVLIFGFDEIKTSLKVMLQNDPKNARRFNFLNSLDNWVTTQQSEALVEQTRLWIAFQLEQTLNTLKKPVPDEQQLLISLSVAHGGITFLKDNILPQIIHLVDAPFLRDFALKIHAEGGLPQSELKSEFISSLIYASLSYISFNELSPKPPQHFGLYYHAQQPAVPNEDLIKAKFYMQACLVTDCTELAGSILNKVADATGLSASDAQSRAKEVMLPLLSFIGDYIQKAGPANSIPGLDELGRTAVDLYMDSIASSPQTLTRSSIHDMIQAVMLIGKPELLVSSIMPKVTSLALSATGLRDFMEEIHVHASKITTPPNTASLQSIVIAMANKYAAQIPLHTTQLIYDALECCLQLRAFEACTLVVKRTVQIQLLKQDYVNTVLIPLLPQLRPLATTYNMMDGLAPFFQTIILAWIENVLGKKPEEDAAILAGMSRWRQACSCHACNTARSFLTENKDPTIRMQRIGAPTCKHVEKFLSQYVKWAATWETITTTPRGLLITKSKAVYERTLWKLDHAKGAAILKTVSPNEDELKRILGEHYNQVVGLLRGKGNVLNVATAHGMSSTSSHGVGGGVAAVATSSDPQEPPPAKKRKTTYNQNDIIDLT